MPESTGTGAQRGDARDAVGPPAAGPAAGAAAEPPTEPAPAGGPPASEEPAASDAPAAPDGPSAPDRPTASDETASDETAAPEGLDAVADELYALAPDAFVPARDDRAAAARAAGDRALARAVARLRRPTRAAWLANLLARHRADELDGLVELARGLARAQHELDGDALRALSGQRHRAVAAMARDAGRLAARRGEPVSDALLREVAGILEAALADPAIAEEVRAGRLTKTVRYSGFGPAGADDGRDAAPSPLPRRPAPPAGRGADGPDAGDAHPDGAGSGGTASGTEADPGARECAAALSAERERAERERAERERAERERVLAAAEADEAAARERQETDEAARDRADDRHAAARERVADLVAALDAARVEEQAALDAARDAAAAARASARDAAAAAVRTARARARLERPPSPGGAGLARSTTGTDD